MRSCYQSYVRIALELHFTLNNEDIGSQPNFDVTTRLSSPESQSSKVAMKTHLLQRTDGMCYWRGLWLIIGKSVTVENKQPTSGFDTALPPFQRRLH